MREEDRENRHVSQQQSTQGGWCEEECLTQNSQIIAADAMRRSPVPPTDHDCCRRGGA